MNESNLFSSKIVFPSFIIEGEVELKIKATSPTDIPSTPVARGLTFERDNILKVAPSLPL